MYGTTAFKLLQTIAKTSGGGAFCMSGPVVHAADSEDEEEQEFNVIAGEGERAFRNGDFYWGSCLENLPDGVGKYLWANGCMYEGEWYKGKNTGKGKISWPSGATYEGDFKAGFMDGIGTYTGVDGSTYKGQWVMNEKHGYGQKLYANGDFYDGYWKHGVPDGRGRYVWGKGNEYEGEWKGGLMCGHGTLTWVSGDKYEGEWLDGLEHGEGVYTWADGSICVGIWNKDRKDCKGKFYPKSALSAASSWDSREDIDSCNGDMESHKDKGSYILACETVAQNPSDKITQNNIQRRLQKHRNLSVDGSKSSIADKPFDSICTWDSDSDSTTNCCDSLDSARERSSKSLRDKNVFSAIEREFSEVCLDELNKEHAASRASRRRRSKRQLKEVKRPGEAISKGHRNYELMLNLQLGIRYTVGRITPEPTREISLGDFGPKARIWMRFPPEGSKFTPPHQSVEFRWKDYCPMVFRNLRELFKIDVAEYMLSICGNDALRELSSPGKSGSVFYLSHDDRFMIKTMKKSEVKVLLEMLPDYYNHVRTYESTLITKFFGLHSIKAAGQKIRFVVMGNMLCSDLYIHRRYDLKGSSQGRSTDKVEIDETTTLKDLDLDFVFHLEPLWYQALLKQIQFDCEFLESQRIMDYSLLLGLHFQAPQYPTIFSARKSGSEGAIDLMASPNDMILEDKWKSAECLEFIALEHDQNGDLLVSLDLDNSFRSARGEMKPAFVEAPSKAGIRLGINMPARAERRPPITDSNSHPEGDLFGEAYDVVLHFGIIDILQDYDITKRLEHVYKSLQFDSLSISAVDPKAYSKRFQDFIRRTFVEDL
ncbi:hypothetical protein SUGI_1074360 [Cryptomeria japonica]|uniref:phosphatidylinositol 4-phosphate 5-kinase 6 n=1 Tax=Cryptomeria japonica TaxID=3369 RepID=UPI00241498B8|nr:phosphatidylinositol 4-phosphate 5-kinase 6 [Cryptomeria japonica]XP_057853222.2 phosphatidylinositol 4-phosphate 5-kinase 6 [Cryptomeria japonica]GLJ50410.1 hypothetical protein SUGI_1074360 [Cryptomeria japonica]